MKPNFKIDLGARVREKITGIEGVVTARIQHLTGCNQYCLIREGTDKDGKMFDSIWFDEERLVKASAPIQHKVSNPGGDSSICPKLT